MPQPTPERIEDAVEFPLSVHQYPPPITAAEQAAYNAAVAAEDTLSAALETAGAEDASTPELQAAETKAVATLLNYRQLLQQRE